MNSFFDWLARTATLGNLWVAIVFLLMISILVAAHEYGHYLFARWFGMGVEEFSIGFGRKPLFVWMRKSYAVPMLPDSVVEPHLQSVGMHGEWSSLQRKVVEPEIVNAPDGQLVRETTDFTVRAWPLGGFVRIKGMNPEEDGSETRIPGGFYSKAPWKRLMVLFAGPLFSVLAGVIVLIGLFVGYGMPKATGEPVAHKVDNPSPAYSAGLRAGDRILSIQEKPTPTFQSVLEIVRDHPGKPVALTFQRADKKYRTSVVPQAGREPEPVFDERGKPTGETRIQGRIGVHARTEMRPATFFEATAAAILVPIDATKGLVGLMTKPKENKDNVGGIVAIVGVTKDAADAGLRSVITLAALLSISVGIFNLLPIAPLDGGQMVIAFVEMLRRGRRLSLRVQTAVASTGVVVLLLLFISVTVLDVGRLVRPKEQRFTPVAVEHKPIPIPNP